MEELPHHCCLLEQLHPLIRLQAVLGHFHSHLHTAHGGLPLPSVHVTELPLPQGLPQMDRTSGKLLVLVLGHLPIDLILSGTGAPKPTLRCCLKTYQIITTTRLTHPSGNHWLKRTVVNTIPYKQGHISTNSIPYVSQTAYSTVVQWLVVDT